MRTLLLTSAAIAAFATSAHAVDLGHGFSFNGKLETAYAIDAEKTTSVATPSITYAWSNITVKAGSDFKLWDNDWVGHDAFDTLPTVDVEAVIAARDNLELKAVTAYDLDTHNRAEITLTAKLSF